jgi:hypothetical protein
MAISTGARCLVTIGIVAFTSAARGQELLTPTALRRFAEALDGVRSGSPVFILACRDSSYRVGAVVPQSEVNAAQSRLGSCYSAFGPYFPPPDPFAHTVLRGCVHDGFHSNMHQIICPPELFPRGEIARMTLVTRLRDSTVHEMPMGADVDAIFLSLAAIDKFVIPYYVRTLGVDSAAAMRAQIVRGLRR